MRPFGKKIQRIFVASGAFKDVFTPQEACIMISNVLRGIMGPAVDIELQPMIDGGECSTEVLAEQMGYKVITMQDVVDPAGGFQTSEYLLRGDNTVFIATSSTLALPSFYGDELKNPLLLTSYGFGQMIKHAYDNGKKDIVIGFGGTSIVDAGIGILQALGATIYDKQGAPLVPSKGPYYRGADLVNVGRVDCESIRRTYADLKIKALCDTTIGVGDMRTPTALKVGRRHAKERAAIVEALQKALVHFSYTLEEQEFVKRALRDWPGPVRLMDKHFFGVAGGVLMGMVAIFHITPVLGVDYFIDLFKIREKVSRADIVVSGEGRFDITLTGKTPSGVARIAQKYHKPFVCLCGTVGEEFRPYFRSCISTDLPSKVKDAGVSTIISCHPAYDQAMSHKTYGQEMSYYREVTPKILSKALGDFFA